MPEYHNAFAERLAAAGMNPGLANAYAKAWEAADNNEKRQRIIDNLNLSHQMIGLAYYGDAMYGRDCAE